MIEKMVQIYLRFTSGAQGWPSSTITTIMLLPASTQLPGISAGSLSYPLEPTLVDKMMSGRERGIFACVSLQARETQVWVISPVKGSLQWAVRTADYRGLRSGLVFQTLYLKSPRRSLEKLRWGS